MRENVLKVKSYAFAIRVVKLYQYLCNELKEYVLGKQVLRSGTAIGALICEGEFAQSKPDFINKLSIALKEANETLYWLNILHDTDYLNLEIYESLKTDNEEIVKLLIASIKTAKGK
ncbi:MAG: four helix bundle protein [Bacteroidetes bacterium]|nr:four helix bundle protein [Bacteroidota bacterium]